MNPSTYKFLADALVAFHFAFVAFVMAGAFVVLRWRRVMWLHLPAVAWGIWIELSGGTCPLTPLENQLLRAGGEASYTGSFVDQYIVPVLYPDGLTRNLQFAIAGVIVLINGTCYGYLLWRSLARARARTIVPAEAAEAALADEVRADDAPADPVLVDEVPADAVPAGEPAR